MNFRNFYTRLRVSSAATQDEIKGAYYSLSKLFHPDVNPQNNTAANNFRHITEAYQVLSSPSSRAAYDKVHLPKHLLKRRSGKSRFGLKKSNPYESAYLNELDDSSSYALQKRMKEYLTRIVKKSDSA